MGVERAASSNSSNNSKMNEQTLYSIELESVDTFAEDVQIIDFGEATTNEVKEIIQSAKKLLWID